MPIPVRRLFDHIDEFTRAVAGANSILLLLDFDGTLAPIVEEPDSAELPQRTRSLLIQLSARPKVTVAIISGRSLADLKRRVGIELIYAGNHGVEIEGPGVVFHGPDLSQAQPALDEIASKLTAILSSISGVFVEHKGLGLSIHLRRVDQSKAPFVVDAVESTCETFTRLIELRRGKEVLEVRPRVNWDKGKAALWILQQQGADGAVCICLGDDATDEDIFRALPNSISIKVGEGRTSANYRILDQDQVFTILRQIDGSIEHSAMNLEMNASTNL